MKKLLVLILLLACGIVANAATVNVTANSAVRPEVYDTSRFLIRVGNPTAQEIQDFKDGNLDLVRFTSTAPILEAAEDDLDSCSAAITLVCGTLSEVSKACSLEIGLQCIGVCFNGIRIKIID